MNISRRNFVRLAAGMGASLLVPDQALAVGEEVTRRWWSLGRWKEPSADKGTVFFGYNVPVREWDVIRHNPTGELFVVTRIGPGDGMFVAQRAFDDPSGTLARQADPRLPLIHIIGVAAPEWRA